ncbi:MAG: hypothetical protein AAGN46_06695 [Acidobacteriota bacterium]
MKPERIQNELRTLDEAWALTGSRLTRTWSDLEPAERSRLREALQAFVPEIAIVERGDALVVEIGDGRNGLTVRDLDLARAVDRALAD